MMCTAGVLAEQASLLPCQVGCCVVQPMDHLHTAITKGFCEIQCRFRGAQCTAFGVVCQDCLLRCSFSCCLVRLQTTCALHPAW